MEEQNKQYGLCMKTAEVIMESLVVNLHPYQKSDDPQMLHYYFSRETRNFSITYCIMMLENGYVLRQAFLNSFVTSNKNFEFNSHLNFFFFQIDNEGLKFLLDFKEELFECTKLEYRYLIVTIYSNSDKALILANDIIHHTLQIVNRLLIESVTVHLPTIPRSFFTIVSMSTGQILNKVSTFL